MEKSESYKQLVSVAPYISFGAIMAWAVLIGDKSIWGPNLEENRQAIVLFYSLTITFFGMSGIAIILAKNKITRLLGNTRFSWIGGGLVFLGTLCMMAYRFIYDTQSLVYMSAVLCAIGVSTIFFYLIFYCEILTFNEILYLTVKSVSVAVVIYVLIHGCYFMVANISLLLLPIIPIAVFHTINFDDRSQTTSEELILRRSALVASLEIFIVLMIAIFLTNQYYMTADTHTLLTLPVQTSFFIFLNLLICMVLLSAFSEFGGWVDKLRVSIVLLFLIAVVYSFLSHGVSNSLQITALLMTWASALFIVLSTSIFIYQTRQLTQGLRTRSELIFNGLIFLAGVSGTPFIHNYIFDLLDVQGLNSIETFWIVMGVAIIVDTAVRAFGPKDELVYEPIQYAQDAIDPKTFWFEACIKMGAEYSLTKREVQVVQLLSMGFSTGYIAQQLEISVYTVRTYVQRAHNKLNINTHDELMGVLYGYL